jgi:protocatechuate 3,4-dioxygenase alpha subunit
VSVFARGLLDRVVTRIYFPDDAEANAADPVLAAIDDPARRATLIAVAVPDRPENEFRFDIWLQGERETVFFDV